MALEHGIRLLPSEWERRLGVKVHDPDGWRIDGKPWDEAITLEDFRGRLCISTVEYAVDRDR